MIPIIASLARAKSPVELSSANALLSGLINKSIRFRPIVDHDRRNRLHALQIGACDTMCSVQNLTGSGHYDRVAEISVEDITCAFGHLADREPNILRPAEPHDIVEDFQIFERDDNQGSSIRRCPIVGVRQNGIEPPARAGPYRILSAGFVIDKIQRFCSALG